MTGLILRFLRSRFGSRWFMSLRADQQDHLILDWLDKSLRSRSGLEQFKLVREIFHRRKMRLFPLLESWRYARVYGFFHSIERVRDVPGDIVEFGVGRGNSLAYMVYALAFFEIEKAVYGFDSFEGFAPGSEQDIGQRVTRAGDTPPGWANTSPDLIQAILDLDREKQSVGESLLRDHPVPVTLVKGFFADTATDGNLPDQIALLHIDCDMYEPTRQALEACLPRMQPGGLIIFDEYHSADAWPGEKKAADELSAAWGLEIVFVHAVQRHCIVIPESFSGQPL